MHMTIGLQTHRAIQNLKNLGVEDKQAEGIANVVASIVDAYQGELATKADFKEVETKLGNKIDKLETEMRTNFAWMKVVNVGILIAAVALILQNLTNH